MTWLLASVRDASEAETALQGGADIIDLKEPGAGALGAVPPRVAGEVVRLAGPQVAVSATVGDLPMEPVVIRDAVVTMLETGVSFVKVGIFDQARADACLQALAPLADAGAGLVAVLFADRDPVPRCLGLVAEAGFHGVMLDTADKPRGGLRTHLADYTIARFLNSSRSLGLAAGLAGSLGLGDIGPLLRLAPDYLGFRGALCGGDRAGTLAADALAQVRRRIPRSPTPEVQARERWASQATAIAGAQSDTLPNSASEAETRLANSR